MSSEARFPYEEGDEAESAGNLRGSLRLETKASSSRTIMPGTKALCHPSVAVRAMVMGMSSRA